MPGGRHLLALSGMMTLFGGNGHQGGLEYSLMAPTKTAAGNRARQGGLEYSLARYQTERSYMLSAINVWSTGERTS